MTHDLRAYAEWCIAHYEDVPPTIVNDLNAAAALIEQQEAKISELGAKLPRWIPVSERLPESNHRNDHVGDVLCYVPLRDGCRQNGVYLGKHKHVEADNGSKNFWGRPTPASDWTLWGWSYFEEPIVTHWMPCPDTPKGAYLP